MKFGEDVFFFFPVLPILLGECLCFHGELLLILVKRLEVADI